MDQKIWIISDTHFNHYNIIRYCNRPFSSVEEMNEALIKKWNEKVGVNDMVIHLGDFCRGNEFMIKDIRDKLNGIIILIRGNHDYRVSEQLGFWIVEGNLQIGNLILSHYPLELKEIPEGMINIHGHIHEKDSWYGKNVSVEQTNYEPVELSNIIV